MGRAHELLEAARNEEDGAHSPCTRREDNAAAWRTASLSFGLLVPFLAVDAALPANP